VCTQNIAWKCGKSDVMKVKETKHTHIISILKESNQSYVRLLKWLVISAAFKLVGCGCTILISCNGYILEISFERSDWVPVAYRVQTDKSHITKQKIMQGRERRRTEKYIWKSQRYSHKYWWPVFYWFVYFLFKECLIYCVVN